MGFPVILGLLRNIWRVVFSRQNLGFEVFVSWPIFIARHLSGEILTCDIKENVDKADVDYV